MARRKSRAPRPTPAPAVPVAAESAAPQQAAAPSFRLPRRGVVLAVVALLVVQWTLAVRSLIQENPTVDEVIHLPAGLTYWQTGSFRMYHHNPPLVKLIAALPVLSAPDLKIRYAPPAWGEQPNMAQFAHEFMQDNAGHYFELFTRGRLMMPGFAALGGLVVFLWSSRLYGAGGGLLSLALWAFCPNILAHGRLVTTDLGATALGAAATFSFWLYLKHPTWLRAGIAGGALGVAQLSKFSLLLLYGLWPVLALAHLAVTPTRRWSRTLAQGIAIAALSVLVIDLGYGFEGVGIPLGQYEFVSESLSRPERRSYLDQPRPPSLRDQARPYRVNRFRGTPLQRLPVPLPQHYMLGFDDQKLEAEGVPDRILRPGSDSDEVRSYPVYLDGELRQKSWWYYYLSTLRYKVPEGTWLLVLTSLAVLLFSPRARAPWFDEFTVLLVPVVVLGVMSVLTNINLGLRYVLPIFPYLYISTGKLVPWVLGLTVPLRRSAATWFLGGALGASIVASVLVAPHYLAYFNWVSGGPAKGSTHLIDSNLDWGQDLVGLRRWVRDNAEGQRIGIAYFGQIHPEIFRFRAEGAFDWFLPPPVPGSIDRAALPRRYRGGTENIRLPAGLYAVSATLMRGLPWRVYDTDRWAPYSVWTNAFRYFEALRPIASVGHSILIYRVSDEDSERLSRYFSSEATKPSVD